MRSKSNEIQKKLQWTKSENPRWISSSPLVMCRKMYPISGFMALAVAMKGADTLTLCRCYETHVQMHGAWEGGGVRHALKAYHQVLSQSYSCLCNGFIMQMPVMWVTDLSIKLLRALQSSHHSHLCILFITSGQVSTIWWHQDMLHSMLWSKWMWHRDAVFSSNPCLVFYPTRNKLWDPF